MTTTREAVALLTGAALGATAAAYLLRSCPDSDAGLGSSGDRPHAEAVAAAPACSSCSCSFAAAADSVGPFTPPGRVRTRAGKAPDPYDSAPRTDYLCWDDYFMSVAFLSAQRSKDPKKQVGACIVDENKVIVGIGYNGFPRGCPDDALSWAKLSASGNVLETKMPYVVHAEANAILNTNARSLHGAHLYVTMYPCCECAKLIIQAGIRAVTYYEAKNTSDTAGGAGKDALYAAAARMLKLSGVRVSQHRPAAPLELCLFSSSGGGERKVQSTPHAEGDGGRELL